MADKVKLIPAPRLKDFVFTEKLGSGTYASVYKAYRKSGGPREVVAVKCVLKSSLNSKSTENLLTEIELLKTLKHDNIVQLKDFQWDDGYIYLIMEFCSGGDLSRFIRSKRTVPEFLAKRFLQQLALALQYMRAKHVSHMDLKPQNILLASSHSPVLKIADFGFAHYLLDDTDADCVRGSPLYMAPEIVTRRHYNERADLWSVGVILYECLFGRAPFASRSLKEVKDKILDTKPIEIPFGIDLSAECRHLLTGLLQREPEMRMSYDDFLNHPFIDLKHRPSPQALQTAIKLVTEAVECDNRQEYAQAVSLYCQALEYFVPAIHFERDLAKKAALRGRVKEYMDRAEELKTRLKPTQPRQRRPPAAKVRNLHRNHSQNNHSEGASTSQVEESEESEAVDESLEEAEYDEFERLCADHPALQAANTVLFSAQDKEEREDYRGALAQYELALEALLKISKDEPAGRRKELLQSQISRWIYHAEAIKKYVEVQDMDTRAALSTADDKDSMFSSVTGSCSIQ